MFFRKGFWIIFASVSVFHIVEDVVWAVVARFTSTPIYLIVLGILAWAMLPTLAVHSQPIRKHWGK